MRIARSRPQQGIALIMVMVVIVVLSILAAGFAYSMKVETRLARNVSFEGDLFWLAQSGVVLARYTLGQQASIPSEAGFHALNQKWAGGPGGTNTLLADISLKDVELGQGGFTVEIADLERRININFANRDMIQRALELMGYSSLECATVIDSIEDWRDPNDDPRMNGTESDYYLGRTARPYLAKNGPIDDLSELLLIRGVTAEMFWGARLTNQPAAQPAWMPADAGIFETMAPATVGFADLFSTAGAPQVNLNTASREVLMLLPGIDANLAEGIVRLRSGFDGLDGTEDDTPFHTTGELVNVGGMPPQFVDALRRVCTVRSTMFEARVRARVDRYERVYVAVLQLRSPRDVAVVNAYWE